MVLGPRCNPGLVLHKAVERASPLITTKTGNFAVGNACYREQPNTVCVDTGSIDKSTVLIEKAAFWYTTGIAMHKTYT